MRLVPALAAVALVGAGSSPAPREPLLGWVDHGPDGTELAQLDPLTLDPGTRVRMTVNRGPISIGPTGTRVAAAANGGPAGARLLVLNRRTLRPTATMRFRRADVLALAWVKPRRVLAVLGKPGSRPSLRLLVVDPDRAAVLSNRRLAASARLVAWRRTGSRLLVLLAPTQGVGPPLANVADSSGRWRGRYLNGIRAGIAGKEAQFLPGVAVDPSGERVVVIGVDPVAVEFDLGTLRVRRHVLSGPRLRWDGRAGPVRTAVWAGRSHIAVTGYSAYIGAKIRRAAVAGLALVDTRTWRVRMLDRRAGEAAVAPGLVLAASTNTSHPRGVLSGIGVVAYGLDGRRRFHVLDSNAAAVRVVGQTAYVLPLDYGDLYRIDLRTKRVVQLTADAFGFPWPAQVDAGGG